MRLATHPEALRKLSQSFIHAAQRILAPPPETTFAEWCEENRYLTTEGGSAVPGPYRLSRTPYLRGIMDAISDPATRVVVVKKAARLGVTEGLINNYIGYSIDLDPGPILVVWPTRDDATEWSKETLPQLFATTVALKDKIPTRREKDSNQTILHKRFPGGWLTAVGANSPRTLRRRNARKVLIDEYDACSTTQTKEGDVGQRAIRRADAFDDAKIIITGSPAYKGASPIERDYEHSTREKLYIPCPHCGEFQVLRWSSVRWDKTYERGGVRKRWSELSWSADIGEGWLVQEHHPDTAHIVCIHCGGLMDDLERRRAVPLGEWRADNPGHKVRGFELNTLASLFPQASLPNLVDEWIKAQRDKSLMQVFINTVLGEAWEDRDGTPDSERLLRRREQYPAEVPMGAGLLIGLVDVQIDRLELLIKGFGIGEESWNILHTRIEGDPSDPEVWQMLDRLWQRPFRHESGNEIRVRSLFVDAAYATDDVAKYVKPRAKLGVRAIRGVVQKQGEHLLRRVVSKNTRMRITLVQDEPFKEKVFARLAIREPGPGYIHFPTKDLVDDDYVRQLSNEVPMLRPSRGGGLKRVFVKKGPNEAVDLEKYALAALYILGAAVRYSLPQLVQQLQPRRPEGEDDGKHPISVAQPQRRRRRRQRFSGYD